MKKIVLGMLGAGVLALVLAPAARADSFLSITTGANTVSCNNSTAALLALCTAGFSSSVGSNQITYANSSFFGFNIGSVLLIGGQPGSATSANTTDSKTAVTNVSAGTATLIVAFASNNFSLPTGSPLTLTASQSGNFATATTGTQAFTGAGDGLNSLTPLAGVTETTPNCVLTGIPAACGTLGTATSFTRVGNFALSGQETMTIAQGSTVDFQGSVGAAPPVPEPSSVLLLGTGMALLAGGGLRRRKQGSK